MGMSRYDVAVVGAGPAGSAAAYYLASGGLRVLLLDRASFPRDKTCGDGLTPRALAVLADMGVLAEAEQAGYRARSLEIFAPSGVATRAPVPGGPGTYSLVLPRLTLDHLLLRRAVRSGAEFESGVYVEHILRDGEGVEVRGRRGRHPVVYRASLALVATGANNALPERLGLLPRRPLLMVAARAYVEALPSVRNRVIFRFDGVPLPGYGWVFPLSPHSANVGAGFLLRGRRAGAGPGAPRLVFERFVQTRPMQTLLAGARVVDPVKSYPLRVDFLRAPTGADRVLLAGEAAGLVNPLTGEGVDYALESGRIAASHIASAFERGDLSSTLLQAYDRALRDQFEPIFRFCTWVRDWLMASPLTLEAVVRLANRRADLKLALIEIALGSRPGFRGVSPWTAARALLFPGRRPD